MITVGIYIKNLSTLEYNRVELFDDEKISVTSSIQNINDIGKTYTDFSQTFTVPATKNNNKIFKHWYENSLDTQFSTLIKADAYIELDTISFRSGKIQLESCDIKNGQPQSYSITFIGNLGNLKDNFAGLFLKDLDTTDYDILYTGAIVKDKVVTTAASSDVMFPLISSNRYWNYGAGGDDDITVNSHPIRFDELFPAVRLKTIFNMVEDKFNVNLQGTTENPSVFLTDAKFTNAYLYLKNSDSFSLKGTPALITWDTKNAPPNYYNINLTNETFNSTYNFGDSSYELINQIAYLQITPTVAGLNYTILTFKNGIEIIRQNFISTTGTNLVYIDGNDLGLNPSDIYSVFIIAPLPITFNAILENIGFAN